MNDNWASTSKVIDEEGNASLEPEKASDTDTKVVVEVVSGKISD